MSLFAMQVTLQAQDGQEIIVPLEIAQQSQLLKNMCDDLSGQEHLIIPLGFSDETLKHVTHCLELFFKKKKIIMICLN